MSLLDDMEFGYSTCGVPWGDYESPYKWKTCPECGGTGQENITLDTDCWRCNGLGKIKVEEND